MHREVEEAKIILIGVSSFLKLAILHQSLNDTILSRSKAQRNLTCVWRRISVEAKFQRFKCSRDVENKIPHLFPFSIRPWREGDHEVLQAFKAL